MEHDALARIESKLEKLFILIRGDGNGEAGFIIRLDRLEQNEKRRRWQMRAVWTGVALAMIANIYS